MFTVKLSYLQVTVGMVDLFVAIVWLCMYGVGWRMETQASYCGKDEQILQHFPFIPQLLPVTVAKDVLLLFHSS